MFDRIVAVVDHDPILLSELTDAIRPYLKLAESQGLTDQVRAQVLRETVDKLIDARLVAHEAEKRGVRVTDSEIDQGIESVMKQNGITKSALQGEIAKTGMTEKEYRMEIARQILEGKMVALVARAKIDASLDPAAMQEKLAKLRKEWLARLRSESYVDLRI